MSNKYVIQWKSKVNGRAGRGTKLFERDEGDDLVQELNRDYPDIQHEFVNIEGINPGPGAFEPASHEESNLEERERPVKSPVISFDA